MLKVKLLKDHQINPEQMANHAAKICYTSSIGDIDTEKRIDVENQLFKTGHHTTFEHQLFNFDIEGISVADITFGLHLTHPYYNTDQRSGRYSKMFDKPDLEEIKEYILSIYGDKNIEEVMDFVKFGCEVFENNIDKATDIAKQILTEERRNDSEYFEKNAKKMAQEQLRNFISTIFLTGLEYSITIPTMVAMYEAPLNPFCKILFDKIKEEFLDQYPDLAYLFREDRRDLNFTSSEIINSNEIKYSSECELMGVYGDINTMVIPTMMDMIPVDRTSYKREYQANSLIDIHSKIRVSVATMGQDQRHRSIKRTNPKFTGNFYSPEVLTRLNIEKDIKELMNKWKNLKGIIDNNLFETLAPYGAIVEYEKKSNINALAHEQLKRLCWCAQEEIYNVNRILRNEIEKTGNTELLKIFLPPCLKECGKCYEGDRQCRRPSMDKSNPCPLRKI